MTKRKNMVEKFQKFFGKLEKKEQNQLMELISAFRGPDAEITGKLIKEETTARIRTLLLGLKKSTSISDSDYFNGRLISFKPLDVDRWIVELTDLAFFANEPSLVHYYMHTIRALKILKELGLK